MNYRSLRTPFVVIVTGIALACSGTSNPPPTGTGPTGTETGESDGGSATSTGGQDESGTSATETGGDGDGDAATGDGDGDGTSGDGDGVVGEAPTVMINHPGEGEMRAVNAAIPMIGVGNDAEDGALTGSSLVWTADTVGEIGTGESFDWTPTQTGPVVITLRATDSDANEAVDAVVLEIIP